MKYYLIFNKESQLQAYTTDKEDIKLFKSQRDMNNFHIETISDKYDPNNFVTTIKDSISELIVAYGFAIFDFEEEYLFEGLQQMILDTKCLAKGFIDRYFKYLKFDDDEKEIIERFIFMIYQHVRKYESDFEDGSDEEPFELNKYFNTNGLFTHIIN